MLMKMLTRCLALALPILLAACDDDTQPDFGDASGGDLGAFDQAVADAARADALPPDAAPPDAVDPEVPPEDAAPEGSESDHHSKPVSAGGSTTVRCCKVLPIWAHMLQGGL